MEDINKYYEIVFQSRLIEKVLGFLICQHSCQNPLLSRFWIVSLFRMSSNDHSWRRKTQSYLKWYISVAIEGNVVHGSRPRVSSSEVSWYQAHKDWASWQRHLGLWWECNRRDAATAARDSQHRLSMMLVIVLSSATERTISLDSIKLYSAAVVGKQTVEKRKMQWWIYWAGQHSRFWIAAVCAL